MKDKLRSILHVIVNLDLIIACILTVIMVLLTIFLVIMRYVLNNPMSWGDEMQLWIFLWIIFLGTSAAFRRSEHVTIEFIVDRLPVRARRIAELIIGIITLAVLFYLMLRGFEYLSFMIDKHRATAQLRIPYSLIYGIMPISCILMMLNLTYATIKRFNEKPDLCKEVDANGN